MGVNASSTSGGYSGSSYKCYLPLNCYAGHGADEIDYIHIEEGASISACAEACNEMWQCEGFVYSGDCCDDNVCKSLLGGKGKVCVAPPPPPCVAPGSRCSPTCPGCPVQQCCGGSTCHALYHGDDSVCVLCGAGCTKPPICSSS